MLRFEEYSYKIEYKKGKENTAADALLRMYPIQQTENTSTLTQQTGESDETHIKERYKSEIDLDETNNEGSSHEDNETIHVDRYIRTRNSSRTTTRFIQ